MAKRKGKTTNISSQLFEDVNPYEKWKVDTAELDDIDKELDKISERTDESIAEIDEFRPPVEESEEGEEGEEDQQPAELEETEEDPEKKQED